MQNKKKPSSNESKKVALGAEEQTAKVTKDAKTAKEKTIEVAKDTKVVEEQPKEAKKAAKLGIKCKGPKLKWDYSKYDDYPVGPNKFVSSPSTVKDPYEGDRCLPMQLEWRIEKRGFKSSPDEKK